MFDIKMMLMLFGFISYFKFDAFCVFLCMYILIFMFLYIPTTYNVDEMTHGFLKILVDKIRTFIILL